MIIQHNATAMKSPFAAKTNLLTNAKAITAKLSANASFAQSIKGLQVQIATGDSDAENQSVDFNANYSKVKFSVNNSTSNIVFQVTQSDSVVSMDDISQTQINTNIDIPSITIRKSDDKDDKDDKIDITPITASETQGEYKGEAPSIFLQRLQEQQQQKNQEAGSQKVLVVTDESTVKIFAPGLDFISQSKQQTQNVIGMLDDSYVTKSDNDNIWGDSYNSPSTALMEDTNIDSGLAPKTATLNDLPVMQENVIDAESTIKDTDVAAEMTKVTINSDMLQATKAMQVQADQQSQGVLQLLQ